MWIVIFKVRSRIPEDSFHWMAYWKMFETKLEAKEFGESFDWDGKLDYRVIYACVD